jgi:hypothetical protein
MPVVCIFLYLLPFGLHDSVSTFLAVMDVCRPWPEWSLLRPALSRTEGIECVH